MRDDEFRRELIGVLTDIETTLGGIGVELEGIARVLAGEPRSDVDEDDEGFDEPGPNFPP